jgi:hypothetical protein
MGDEDGDKRQKYFEDRKRERERQLKEKKKCQNSTFCLYSQTLNLQFYGS